MTRHQNKAPTSPLSSAGLSPGEPQVPADIPGGAGGTGGRRPRRRHPLTVRTRPAGGESGGGRGRTASHASAWPLTTIRKRTIPWSGQKKRLVKFVCLFVCLLLMCLFGIKTEERGKWCVVLLTHPIIVLLYVQNQHHLKCLLKHIEAVLGEGTPA